MICKNKYILLLCINELIFRRNGKIIGIFIDGKEGKELNDAIKLLKENGFDFKTEYSLKEFFETEADFRLSEGVSLNEEQQEIYDALEDDEKMSLASLVSDEYMDSEFVFDYDYMDEIAVEVFKDFIQK